ncbi:hypothetical protein PIB30_007383 [Stylosanthes scabra]|uniref:GRAM domain-containing protein n=1 Tax=Stylosanthes scabra TaxID=79078 RepID=A0ABU6Z2F6_9FABA|nr:hypothetical protein [Stylosanthes scabra]
MGCKALLVLVMFMVTILLTATEEAPRDLLHEKYDQNDDNNNGLARAVDESNQYRGGGSRGFDGRGGYRGGGFGGRGGYGGPRRGGSGWRGGYDGSPWGYGDLSCDRCCTELVTGIPIISRAFGKPSKRYLGESFSGKYHNKSTAKGKQSSKLNSVLTKMNKFGSKADNFANEVRKHVRLGGMKISNTMKGKLSFGAKILEVGGGVKKSFIKLFGMKEREKLLKASKCYLSTTSGLISGLLFISTHKVAFCSDRSINISSSQQDFSTSSRIHYKVAIPIEKINCVNQSQNVQKPSENDHSVATGGNIWGDILAAGRRNEEILKLFQTGVELVVGDGGKIKFWHESWLKIGVLRDRFPRLYAVSNEKLCSIKYYDVWNGLV